MPDDQPSLTQTRIELATLVSLPTILDTPAANLPFPELVDSAAYENLYRGVLAGSVPYTNRLTIGEGAVLDKLYAFCEDYEIWQRYLDNAFFDDFPAFAWARLLPLKASLRPRIVFMPPAAIEQRGIHVSLKPWILVYPLGWALWLSFLVSGEHDLEDVSSVVRVASEEASYTLPGSAAAGRLTLRALNARLAQGLRGDVAGPNVPRPRNDVLRLVTVTRVKQPSYLSSANLTDAMRATLFDIAWPDRGGQAPGDAIKVRRKEPANFVVNAPFGSFLWIGPLLTGQKPFMARKLDCYHNNTWNSLILAWIHAAAFEAARTQKSVLTLAQGNAVWYQARPAYRPEQIMPWRGNAILKRFIADLGLVQKAAELPAA